MIIGGKDNRSAIEQQIENILLFRTAEGLDGAIGR